MARRAVYVVVRSSHPDMEPGMVLLWDDHGKYPTLQIFDDDGKIHYVAMVRVLYTANDLISCAKKSMNDGGLCRCSNNYEKLLLDALKDSRKKFKLSNTDIIRLYNKSLEKSCGVPKRVPKRFDEKPKTRYTMEGGS